MKESVFVSKLNVLIIFGGDSQEHSISEKSAESIFKNISKEKYNIYAAGITKNGTWYLYSGDTQNISDCKWEKNINNKQIYFSTDNNIIIKNNNDFEKIKIDVAVPVLHGKNGEDGTVQGFLEILKIPYVGCHTTSSALCMDKIFTNIILDYYNINKAKFYWFNKYDFEQDPDKYIKETEDKIQKYPMFVKPANAGSSVGISKVKNTQELIDGVKKALQEDTRVLIEEEIIGRELECAVLGNNNLISSCIGEILPANEFYDYDAKYISDSKTCVPEDLSPEIVKNIQETAKKAYKILDCAGLSRVDFFLEKNTNKIYLNEINTFPGFTSISMYPKLLELNNIKYSDLIDKLIDLALNYNKN